LRFAIGAMIGRRARIDKNLAGDSGLFTHCAACACARLAFASG
jgi:hypothetical protein